jgi:hypothetical protein
MSSMPTPLATPRRLLRSLGALLTGIVAVVALSLGTDMLMHVLGVFPPPGQPMRDSRLLLLAFAYRSVYGIFGGYLVARLAPYAPMGHALVSGVIGLVVSTIGAVAMWNHGPNWYPVALAVTALPYAWIGGLLERRFHG